MFNPEDHQERVDETNVAFYVAGIDMLEGTVTDALDALRTIVAIDANASIEDGGDSYDGHYWQIRWRRALRPEEIEKRERDKRNRSAERAALEAQQERALFDRLKAKYEPTGGQGGQ